MMNNKQIDELNELLVDHGEALTAFYDEGIHYGMFKGATIGAIGSAIGVVIMYGIIKLKSRTKKNKIES